MITVIILKVVIMSVIILNVVMTSVIVLNVIMMSVVAPSERPPRQSFFLISILKRNY
jgi:hypothetical protein